MIRDAVSSTELDVLLFIAERPRTVEELSKFMTVEYNSVLVRLCRMKKKNLVTNAAPGSHVNSIYNIGAKGKQILAQLAEKLKAAKAIKSR